MVNKIEISPEQARLAQLKTRQTGLPLSQELARSVFSEAVMELDDELGLVLDESETLSSVDQLVHAVGVNDVYINGRHVDVRAIDAEGRVSLCRALIGTPYLSSGTFVVALDDVSGGSVVSYIGPGTWLAAEEQSGNDDRVFVNVRPTPEFDLSETLNTVCCAAQISFAQTVRTLPDQSEIERFVNNRGHFIMARQKQMVTAAVINHEVRETIGQTRVQLSREKVTKVLSTSAVWVARVERMVEKLSESFPALKKEEIAQHVLKTGEKFGGQPENPQFRKHLLEQLSKEQLARKFQGQTANKLAGIMDQMLNGRSASDAVNDLVKNKFAVAIAVQIKQQRRNIHGFVAATAEEIGAAFQQLAVQPAYATHSVNNAESGVEAINEALQLLEATNLVEEVKRLDSELAGS